MKKTQNNNERISQLLTMLWNTSSPARQLAIVNQILEINPDNLEALIVKADQIQNQDKRLELLLHALKVLEKKGDKVEDKAIFFISIAQRIAFTYMGLGNFDKAFEYCEIVLKFCEENPEDELPDEDPVGDPEADA